MSSQRTVIEGRQKPAPVASEADEELMCPLCMEILDETDRNFFPCTCDYQVCLWCLHYIRTTMGNKCPACRRDYEESNMKYKSKPHTPAPQRTTVKKKQRDLGDKEATTREEVTNSPRNNGAPLNMKDIRVIQRNLVYVVGIPSKFAKKEILKQNEYFGQYGKIQHLVINKSQNYNSHVGGPSYTAYVTYTKKSEAVAAITGIDGSYMEGKMLRASYGTTKYCTFFFKGMKCTNTDCFYLHHFGDERERITKEDLAGLMNKSVNPPFGVVDPWNNTDSAAKPKEEQNRKRTNSASQMKQKSLPSEKTTKADTKDRITTPATAANERDSNTWANIAAGSKEAVSKSRSASCSVYPAPEEGENTEAAPLESHGDSCANNGDVSQKRRGDSAQNTPMRVPNNYVPPVEVEHKINVNTTDQYDLMQRHFNMPLLFDLQRYNRCDHIFYVMDVTQPQGQSSGHREHLRGVRIANSIMGVYGSQCMRWVMADEIKKLDAFHLTERRMHIDYYKGRNNLKPPMEGESAISGGTSAHKPNELFTSNETMDNIMKRLKRHSNMLDSLAELYGDEALEYMTQAEANEPRPTEFDIAASSAEVYMHNRPEEAFNQPTSSDSIVNNSQHGSSILFASSIHESQLEEELRLHEEMMNQTQKLMELQLEREQLFASHLRNLEEVE